DASSVVARGLRRRIAGSGAGAEDDEIEIVSHRLIVSNAGRSVTLERVENEAALVEALRAGDETAFRALIDMYHAMLVRVARMYVSTQAVAEEVAQETWLAVLEGIGRFE